MLVSINTQSSVEKSHSTALMMRDCTTTPVKRFNPKNGTIVFRLEVDDFQTNLWLTKKLIRITIGVPTQTALTLDGAPNKDICKSAGLQDTKNNRPPPDRKI